MKPKKDLPIQYAKHKVTLYQKIMVILSLIFIFSVAFCFIIGPSFAKTAGMAVGSYDGVTNGLGEGAKDGKEIGLSAQDTTAKIETAMTSSGKLQVLLVDLQLTDIYRQGDTYAALLSLKGDGVYSVDLTKAKTTYDKTNDKITIEIPEPNFDAYLDDSTIEIVAEYQHWLLDGSTLDGYTGYLNSRDQIEEKIHNEFRTGDMMEQAKDLALKQTERLAKSVCGSDASIEILFLNV